MIKTVEDFKKAAVEKDIDRWTIHSCGFCGYPCGYIIQGDNVWYDSGCGCTSGVNVEPRTWEELADHYNRNQPENNPRISPEWLAKVNNLWGFTEQELGTDSSLIRG